MDSEIGIYLRDYGSCCFCPVTGVVCPLCVKIIVSSLRVSTVGSNYIHQTVHHDNFRYDLEIDTVLAKHLK